MLGRLLLVKDASSKAVTLDNIIYLCILLLQQAYPPHDPKEDRNESGKPSGIPLLALYRRFWLRREQFL